MFQCLLYDLTEAKVCVFVRMFTLHCPSPSEQSDFTLPGRLVSRQTCPAFFLSLPSRILLVPAIFVMVVISCETNPSTPIFEFLALDARNVPYFLVSVCCLSLYVRDLRFQVHLCFLIFPDFFLLLDPIRQIRWNLQEMRKLMFCFHHSLIRHIWRMQHRGSLCCRVQKTL